MAEFISIFTKAEAEMYGPAILNVVVRDENSARRHNEMSKLAEKQFDQQFFDAGVSKDDLGKAQEKFGGKNEARAQRIDIAETTLTADYKTYNELYDEIQLTYELQDPTTPSEISALNNGEYVNYFDEAMGSQGKRLQDLNKKVFTLDGSSPSRAVQNGFQSVKRSIYHADNRRISTFENALFLNSLYQRR